MSDEVDSYDLRRFEEGRLDQVEAEWSEYSGKEEFEVELGSVFEWCAAHPEEALELFNKTKGKTDAILEVVESHWGTKTKLLKIYLSPEFWPFQVLTEDVARTHAGAYAAFIIGGLSSGVNEVKIYGRTDIMLTLLSSLERLWPTYDTGSVAKIQGRWLSITRN